MSKVNIKKIDVVVNVKGKKSCESMDLNMYGKKKKKNKDLLKFL